MRACGEKLSKKKTRLCSLDGCEGKHVAKGYCWKHYERHRKFGDSSFTKTASDGEPLAFLLRAKIAGPIDGCLIWPFGRQADGYGALRYEGRMQQAHRVSLFLAVGEPPNGKPLACHSPKICHNRLCVNPAHLRWASAAENEADKVLDGTNRSKLTRQDVIAIKGMLAEGISGAQISKSFDVTAQHVNRIKNGHIWSEVTL